MYCKKCGREIPTGSKFCVYCGIPVSSGLTDRTAQTGNPQLSSQNYQPGAAAAARPKKHTKAVWITVIVLFVAVILGYRILNQAENKDPLYGTWYVPMSQVSGELVTVEFGRDTVEFGAGAIRNHDKLVCPYEREANQTLKIHSEQGDDYAECTYQIEDDKLILSSQTEDVLNLMLAREPMDIKVPIN